MNHPTPEEYKAAEEHQRRSVEEAWQNTDLESMTDKVLAQWHSRQKPYSREYVLADQQWRIRLLNRQLRASRWLAAIACATTLAGVCLGYYLHLMHSVPVSELPQTKTERAADQKAK